MTKKERMITVCDKCLQASCWQAIFMCNKSRDAGVVSRPESELLELKLEHPSYLKTDEELQK